MTSDSNKDLGTEEVLWKLDDLYSGQDDPKHGLLSLSDIFKKYAKTPEKTAPLLFLSAGSPGELENIFVKNLKKYQIATAFRMTGQLKNSFPAAR